MQIRIDYQSGKPPYLQIVEQIKHAAATGVLRAGEPLPSIRPLAEELRINRNTVAKAYAELENAGIVETHPGKGCFLSDNHSPLRKAVRQQIVTDAIDHAIVQAHHLQIEPVEFLKIVQARLEHFDASRPEEEK